MRSGSGHSVALYSRKAFVSLSADYTMTGEQGSALLKLGHFTRIVGLTLERC